MIRTILSCFLLLHLSAFGHAQIDIFRKLYFEANSDAGINKFYQTLSMHRPKTEIERAYQGVATAMYASLADGVKAKFSFFENGKKLLEQAVLLDPENPEIRFLRFSVQAEVPWVVGYSSNLEKDADLIINALEKNKIDYKIDFWKKAVKFLQNSGELTTQQKTRLDKFV